MLLHKLHENDSIQMTEATANAPLNNTALYAENIAEDVVGKENTLVDFYITDPAYRSLSVIRSWAKVVLVGMGVMTLMNLLASVVFIIFAFKQQQFNGLLLFQTIRSAGYLALTSWITYLLFNYIKYLNHALKSNDNPALAKAFKFQSQFFKWAFIMVAAGIGARILEAAL